MLPQTIQHFMVGSDSGAAKPSESVLQLLVRSELMYSPYVSTSVPSFSAAETYEPSCTPGCTGQNRFGRCESRARGSSSCSKTSTRSSGIFCSAISRSRRYAASSTLPRLTSTDSLEKQDLVETIGFLFMLGSLELGRAYLTDTLSSVQLSVLKDLADYGLVYRPSVRFLTLSLFPPY